MGPFHQSPEAASVPQVGHQSLAAYQAAENPEVAQNQGDGSPVDLHNLPDSVVDVAVSQMVVEVKEH